MGGVNKVILVGNLGADPEIKFTNTGMAIANFRMATSDARTGKDGNKEERTEWHRVVAFGKLAEICGEWLNKGKQVYIEGKLQTREWEDRDGNRRWTTEILADRMVMLGSGGERKSDGSGRAAADSMPDSSSGKPPEDDVPF